MPPMRNFMDAKFKNRASTPSMILGFLDREEQNTEIQYSSKMLRDQKDSISRNPCDYPSYESLESAYKNSKFVK